MITLFKNETADDVTGVAQAAKGGTPQLWLQGDIASGTFTLEGQYKGGNWRTLKYSDGTDISFTVVDDSPVTVSLKGGTQVRGVLASATNPNFSAFLV